MFWKVKRKFLVKLSVFLSALADRINNYLYNDVIVSFEDTGKRR